MIKRICVLTLVALLLMSQSAIVFASPGINFNTTGKWYASKTYLGFENDISYYTTETGASARWFTPYNKPGTYRVWFYKILTGKNDDSSLSIEIVHNKQKDIKIANCAQNPPGWVDLGLYYFSGEGGEYVEAVRKNSNKAEISRVANVRFEPTVIQAENSPENVAEVEETDTVQQKDEENTSAAEDTDSIDALRKHSGYQKTSPMSEELRLQREKAKFRERKIIYNNDGNDTLKQVPNSMKTPEVFLSMRTSPLAGSQVDSIFYCTGVYDQYTNKMAGSEPRYNKDWTYDLSKNGKDSLEVMVDFGQKNDIEVFWSMRMNDTHDITDEVDQLAKFKKENLDCLVGNKGVKLPFGGNRWSALDYSKDAVRIKSFDILKEICERYDVDGIELDFWRHPIYFKETALGEPVKDEHIELMNDFIRNVRYMTEEISQKKGKPILIAVHATDSFGYNKALGLDLEQWLKEGLVDVWISGDYFRLEPYENVVAQAKKYNVPVYADINTQRVIPKTHTYEEFFNHTRNEAYYALKAGMDGVYTFNYFRPSYSIFWEIGSLETLKNFMPMYAEAYINPDEWSKPGVWLKNGMDFYKGP